MAYFTATAWGFGSQREKQPNLYNIFKKAKLKFSCLVCPKLMKAPCKIVSKLKL